MIQKILISTALIPGEMCHMQQLAEHQERGEERLDSKKALLE